jgi:hypothetical protein
MTPQDFYRAQSKLSDPGAFASLFDALPDDLTSLCQAVRNIYIHYMSGRIPQNRKTEVDLRYVNDILNRVQMHDLRPLSVTRVRGKKVVGCCRDAALLLCSMLRHKGIPARIRVGFATYIRVGLGLKPFKIDHVVTEYWDATAVRWKLVDAEQDENLIQRNQIDFDVHDIPRDRFLVGGRAWQIARRSEVDPNLFCGGPDDFFKGMWAIRNRMLCDLSALNKAELLLWDTWGWMVYEFKPTQAETALLDHIAELTQGGDEVFDEIRQLYADPRFQVPPAVTCYSPATKWKTVALTV